MALGGTLDRRSDHRGPSCPEGGPGAAGRSPSRGPRRRGACGCAARPRQGGHAVDRVVCPRTDCCGRARADRVRLLLSKVGPDRALPWSDGPGRGRETHSIAAGVPVACGGATVMPARVGASTSGTLLVSSATRGGTSRHALRTRLSQENLIESTTASASICNNSVTCMSAYGPVPFWPSAGPA